MKKYLAIAVITVILAGCGDEQSITTGVIIDVTEWTCTNTQVVPVEKLTLRGRVPVRKVEEKRICIEWSKMIN